MLAVVGLLLLAMWGGVRGHGMMVDPPQRSSMWRFPDQFPDAPKNWEDNELFCGGASVMHHQNNHMCGVCGDNYADPQPRDNEAGGHFGRGVIVRTYHRADVIDVTIRITANHLGYFLFKLCPNNDVSRIVTQACLDQHPLQVIDNNGHLTDRYLPGSRKGDLHLQLKLPAHVTCTQCVLQWTYKGGNNWGCDSEGHCATGLGDQETFVNCADVAILNDGVDIPTSATATHSPIPTTTATTTTKATDPPATMQPATSLPPLHSSTSSASGSGSLHCHDVTGGRQGLDDWCVDNCAKGYCPPNFCKCD